MFAYAFILILTVHHSKSSTIGTESASVICEINPFEQSSSPLIMRSGETTLLYPNAQKTVLINQDEQVNFICPTGVLIILDANGDFSDIHPIGSVSATCNAQQQIAINNNAVLWEKVICVDKNTYSKFTGNPCGHDGNGQEADIGFRFNNELIKIIELCYDKVSQSPRYSRHTLTASIALTVAANLDNIYAAKSQNFMEDIGFYHLDKQVSKLYDNSKSVLDGKQYDYVLTKGHFAPNADFVHPFEQRATYRYINVAPQWEKLNTAFWNNVERNIRKYVKSHSVDLEVWTGTHGVATLDQTQLYLYTENNEGVTTELYPSTDNGESVTTEVPNNNIKKALPVPKLFWKIVYDRTNNKAVAFIGINELIDRQLTQTDYICDDLWNTLTWVSKRKSFKKNNSYAYACAVNDPRLLIQIPDINYLSVIGGVLATVGLLN